LVTNANNNEIIETIDLSKYVSKEYIDRDIDYSFGDAHLDTTEPESAEIIHTKFWDLPVNSLSDWRPFTAYLDYSLFLGPAFNGYGKGLNLYKDLMGGIHGARGSGKSLFLSYLLAKKMRSGRPVWSNYPISFFVIEPDGKLTYYESMPLDFNKFYAFSPLVRNGAVGITELQYYVEARTSGKAQNRIATYQIMQLRKTALSFMYDVQDRAWVDKRFGWSNDFDIECQDIAKLGYSGSTAHGYPKRVYDAYGKLREGAFTRFRLEDTSGVLTGAKHRDTGIKYGPYQFAGFNFWDIYPTHFIVDAYEAMNSYKKPNKAQEKRDIIANSLEKAADWFLKQSIIDVPAPDLWEKTIEYAGQDIDTHQAGKQLKEWGISRRQSTHGIWRYDLSILTEE